MFVNLQWNFTIWFAGCETIFSPSELTCSCKTILCRFIWNCRICGWIQNNSFLCRRPGILVLVNDTDWELLVCKCRILNWDICILSSFFRYRANLSTNCRPTTMFCSFPHFMEDRLRLNKCRPTTMFYSYPLLIENSIEPLDPLLQIFIDYEWYDGDADLWCTPYIAIRSALEIRSAHHYSDKLQ